MLTVQGPKGRPKKSAFDRYHRRRAGRPLFLDRTPIVDLADAKKQMGDCFRDQTPEGRKLTPALVVVVARAAHADPEIRKALRDFWRDKAVRERDVAWRKAQKSLQRLQTIADQHPQPELFKAIAQIEELGLRSWLTPPMVRRKVVKGLLARRAYSYILAAVRRDGPCTRGDLIEASTLTCWFLRAHCPSTCFDADPEVIRKTCADVPPVRKTTR